MLSFSHERLQAAPWARPGPAATTLVVLAFLLFFSAEAFAHLGGQFRGLAFQPLEAVPELLCVPAKSGKRGLE